MFLRPQIKRFQTIPKFTKSRNPLHAFSSTTKLPKKSLSPLGLAYNPDEVEKEWYEWWENSGFFHGEPEAPGPSQKPKFSMVVPPPNVTGSLHIGHALTTSIQDALCRWKRMSGHNVVWVPGTDHAGIATQVVVEKKIMREKGLTRHDLGRDAFLQEVWKWKDEYGGTITKQMRRMGASLDWTREVFTMDEQRSHAVNTAFVRMFEDGLIYRSDRLVNWCPALRTAISDIEVEYDTLEGRTEISIPGRAKKVEFGVIHEFKYPLVPLPSDNGETRYITVGTTRLETMLGDTAIAVHPEDPRYKDLIGRLVAHPFFPDRKVPIVADPVLVDMAFGTGAVKVTPAHSFDDQQCAQRNGLQTINIMNEDGTLNENAGSEFTGVDRFDARDTLIKNLTSLGLYLGKKDNPMRIARCSRSKDVLEPLMKPQWYVKCGDLAAHSLDLVKSGKMKILPSMFEVQWYRWLENIHDWCISRQLWWGHRVPAYRVRSAALPQGQDQWVAATTLEEAQEKARKLIASHCPSDKDAQYTLTQDEDVLDTWFSSGIFPLSVLGWPNTTPELEQFYPLDVMETGSDILFFWVARMSMMCSYLHPQKKQPFDTVYLHAVVRDAQGRKMSKSIGNVIDPLHVIQGISLQQLKDGLEKSNLDPKERAKASSSLDLDFPNGIEKCGTDALRVTLANYTQQGRQINMDVQRVVSNRNFCNKMWQATRFALSHLDQSRVLEPAITHQFPPLAPLPLSDLRSLGPMSLADSWILSRLAYCVDAVTGALQSYEFSDATDIITNFFIHDLCDVYIEFIKPALQNKDQRPIALSVLTTCLDTALRLAHPFMPFITEELWQRLPRPAGETVTPISIMVAPFPQSQDYSTWRNEETESKMEDVLAVMHTVRSMRQTRPLDPSTLLVSLRDTERGRHMQHSITVHTEDLIKQCKVEKVVIGINQPVPKGFSLGIVSEDCSVGMPLKPEGVALEVSKLKKKLDTAQKERQKLVTKRDAPHFEEKVPEKIKAEIRTRIQQLDAEVGTCEEALSKLQQEA